MKPTVSVSPITNTGQFSLIFSQPMLLDGIQANSTRVLAKTELTEEHLLIMIDAGESENAEMLTFTWWVIEVTSQQIKIQLNFDNPLYVSS